MSAATVTVDRPTVRVRDLARALGLAPLEGDLVAHATAHGVELEVGKDWSGQPAVTEANAAQLVAATERRGVQQRQAKRRRQRELQAAETTREREIAAAAKAAYQSAFDAGLRHGDRDVELRAWLASVNAGLERRAQLAEAEQPAATEPRPRRWWQR